MAKTDSPSLWQSLSEKQVFLCSLLTGRVSSGPSLVAAAWVPDLHHFRGNFGGKDVIPLYRDREASIPNLTKGLAHFIGSKLGLRPPTVEDFAAYSYALLASSAYQARFAEALRTPGLRVPLTADPALWAEAIAAGQEMLWLHTYGERFRDTAEGRGRQLPLVAGLGWQEPVTRLPADMNDIEYDQETQTLKIGNGCINAVRPDVWAYEVSGMSVVRKWLSYRTAKAAGRAATSSSELDQIRPTEWIDEWNDELLDLIRVLTATLDMEGQLSDLLARICGGKLIEANELPSPTTAERKVPPTTSAPAFSFEGGA